jgi:hypothetical protein
MCNFKSGIVVRDEREKCGFKLFLSPWTESHSELETLFKLRDRGENLAKVEFTPAKMEEAYKVETYKLRLDSERRPSWYTKKMESEVEKRMAKYISSIIVTGKIELLYGGQFIIAPGAKIGTVNHCVISVLSGGTISNISGGTISNISGGTISDIWEFFDGKIGNILKAAKIGKDNRPKK